MELINNLGFASYAWKDENMERENPVYKSLQQGLKEMELAKEGKLKTRSLKEFLDEIQRAGLTQFWKY